MLYTALNFSTVSLFIYLVHDVYRGLYQISNTQDMERFQCLCVKGQSMERKEHAMNHDAWLIFNHLRILLNLNKCSTAKYLNECWIHLQVIFG